MPPRERFDPVAGRPARAGGRGQRTPREADASKFEHRRREITLAAVAPLNQHGVRGMTLGDVAARLGLAPTAVGYYFKGKEDLAASCYIASLERLSRLLDEVEASGPTGRVQTLIRKFFEFRRRVELGEEEDIAWFEDVRTIHRKEVDEAYVALFRRLRALFDEPVASADKVIRNAAAHQVLSQLTWAVGWLPQVHVDDYGRVAERLIDVLENGLANPGAAWAPTSLAAIFDSAGEDDPRQVFLRAATELINEHGYLGASVQKISARVNVTKGSFYHHHSAKDDLVVLCFQRTHNVFRRAQTAADALTSTGFDNLASVATCIVQAHLSGSTPLLRAAALAAVPADIRPQSVAGFVESARRVASVVCDGFRDGSVRPVDALVAGHVLAGAINSAAELPFWATGMEPGPATEAYLRPLFMGLLKTGA